MSDAEEGNLVDQNAVDQNVVEQDSAQSGWRAVGHS